MSAVEAGMRDTTVQRRAVQRYLVPLGVSAAIILLAFALLDWIAIEYAYLATYTILQYVVLATAWNIFGGYAGYVNFGVAAFFALGVYASVVNYLTLQLPLPVMILIAGVISGVVGLGMGYLTLRLRGVFFSIATLAFAVVLNTIFINWHFVGGSRGVSVVRPEAPAFFNSYTRYLFAVMLLLAVASVLIARAIEYSWLGRGLAAIRDDELAAECSGVPALRLKLMATTISGALMGMAGAPFPYYITYVDPASAFSLTIAVNTVAMPVIGGMTTWIGPVIGAMLLGTLQQVATVTISSVLSLMLVGVLLVVFVALAPRGIVGVVKDLRERTK
ncbi:MAG TPA: branched-chain amino acid ABC transporter permease [Xanthobacteraceae bacterium]|nr:branched-chain amino acid ABC transporter permease [Xanthobacteraceae bacterium]